MKTHKKVLLDEWFGKPGVRILNLAARMLGNILSIDHSMEKPPSRIVVCKFLGMGSIIQATPLLRTLRKNFPDAKICFVTSAGNKTLLENIADVNEVYCIDDSKTSKILSSTFGVLRKLWRHKADLYIDLETYSYFSTALATLSCARNRFGFYRIERNIRMGVYTHMMFFNTRAPIAQSYLQMARLAGCTTIEETLPEFNISEETKQAAHRKMSEIAHGFPNEYIVVNPNASDLRIERRWPADRFVLLIMKLCTQYPDKKFFMIGSANEREWVNHIHEKFDAPIKERVFNTAGDFSLVELFELIKGAELVITNDTGPMHISFVFGRPTVSLFGPASPSQYGENPHAYGIYKNIYCSPCVHDFLTPPCHGDNQCMKQITVEEVSNLCVHIITHLFEEAGAAPSPMNFVKDDHVTSLGIINRVRIAEKEREFH